MRCLYSITSMAVVYQCPEAVSWAHRFFSIVAGGERSKRRVECVSAGSQALQPLVIIHGLYVYIFCSWISRAKVMTSRSKLRSAEQLSLKGKCFICFKGATNRERLSLMSDQTEIYSTNCNLITMSICYQVTYPEFKENIFIEKACKRKDLLGAIGPNKAQLSHVWYHLRGNDA